MTIPYRAVPVAEVMKDFSPERKARTKAMAAEMIAEEMAFRALRKARALRQEQLATRLGGKQVYVSRLEKRGDVKLSTLRGYVKALGGDLQLLVTFPDGASMKIRDSGTPLK